MYRNLITTLCLILFLSFVTNTVQAEEGLIGWWPLDQSISGITADVSGNERNGTLVGDCELVTDPERGTVLRINSTSNSWVNCGGGGTTGWANQLTVSVSAWVKINQFECTKQIIASNGLSYMVSRYGDSDHLRFWTDGFGDHDNEVEGTANIQDGNWHHVVFTYDRSTGARYLYVDCEVDACGSYVVDLAADVSKFIIGGSEGYTGRCWKGLIDDVRLYNIALTKRQIRILYGGPFALKPTPADETGNLPITTTLSWQPNQNARPTNSQDVYFGTDWYDVRDGIEDVHIGVQDSNSFAPGTLNGGTTYYWRVDQIDDANQIHSGYIWSFRTETQGYYMDLFKDSGIQINRCTEMPAANVLALSFERLSVYNSSDDQVIQDSVVIGNGNDENGVYLYPDGQPRFRCIYIAGGASGEHGESYGPVGRQRINQYFDNGGSYSGSCAGAFLCSKGCDGEIREYFFHLWPAYTANQKGKFKIDYDIPADSPLLNYYDFSGGEGDRHIDDLQHWNGPFVNSTNPDFWTADSEALARFDSTVTDKICAGQVSIWAWKKNGRSGRLVPIGSHPERVPTGKQRDLMAGALLYAMAGNGQPPIKATLQKGILRKMNDNQTAGHEKIGDKQYHHFTIAIPPTDANDIIISLYSDSGHDLNLFARFDDFAFQGEEGVIAATNDSNAHETIEIKNPQSGTWYIVVKGVETVERTPVSWGWQYSGNSDVLNGVAYAIGVDVKPPHKGDINGDGKVNIVDLNMLTEEWLSDHNQLIPRGNLLGRWNFDNFDANDSSGNEHQGSLEGNAIIVNDPQRGAVLCLDGDGDYVDLGNSNWTNPGNNMTVTAWIKVDKFDVSYQTIIAKGIASYRLSRSNESNYLSVYMNYASGSYQGIQGNDLPVNDAQWHLAAMTYDGNTMKLYIDGQIEGANTLNTLYTTSANLCIGRNVDNTARDWQGWIDDVRLYDYPLDLDDIQRIYAGMEPLDKYQCNDRPASDLNDDCLVNLADFAILAYDWFK